MKHHQGSTRSGEPTPPVSRRAFAWLSTLFGRGSRPDRDDEEVETAQGAEEFNLLVVSDMHLGESTKDRSRIRYLKAAVVEDREFCRFLEHHQERRLDGLPWCLVLAGDIFDLLAISVTPDPRWAEEHYGFTISEAERHRGLENGPAKTMWKLDRILDRHPAIVTYLADFIGSGHRVIFMRGNHDAALFWPEVQEELLDRLMDTYFGGEEVEGITPEEFRSRIGFCDWILHVPGVVHIQHGHQYDEYSSLQHVLQPLRPGTRELMELSSTAILVAYGISKVRGVRTHDKDDFGLLDYLRWFRELGPAKAIEVTRAYLRSIWEMLRYWRTVRKADLRPIMEKHQAAMESLAEQEDLSLDTLQAIDAMGARPNNRGYLKILVSSFFDSVALLLSTPLLLLLWALLSPLPWWQTLLGGVALLGASVLLIYLSEARRETDVIPKLRVAAQRISEIVKTPLIVMGHSHLPEAVQLDSGAVYLNSGCWLYPEVQAEPHGDVCDCPTTYLSFRLHGAGGFPDAALMRWCTQREHPEPFLDLDPTRSEAGSGEGSA